MPVQRATNLSHPQANAPRQKLDYEVPYFGSLNTTADPTALNEEDSPDNLNVAYDTVGAAMSRQGYTKLLTTTLSNPIQGMFPFYKSDGTRQLIYASGNQLFKYNNAGGSTVLAGAPATFTSNKQWAFDEYQDAVYGGNGFDPLISYNGSSYSIANAGITPQFVKIHRNRVYCANLNSSIVYFSDAGSPTSFPANNFISINTNDGQNITGIAESGDDLLIFKDDSIWILSGEPLGAGNTTTIGNLQLTKVNTPNVGCSAFRTIVPVDGVIFFFHYSGIYYYENRRIQEVSPGLATTYANGFNPGFLSSAWATYNPWSNLYILGFAPSSVTTPSKAITFNTLTKGLSIWDDMPGSCGVNFKFSGNVPTVLMGDPNKGIIYNLFNGYSDIAGDNGTATGGSVSTLIDTTKTWTTNQFTDCRVKLYSVTGATIATAVVLSNTSTTLTFVANMSTAPTNGALYSIGYYDSYWTTKIFDFNMVAYTKKYRFFNAFIDAQIYNVLFGQAIDFAVLDYQKVFKLTSNTPIWGTMVWGSFTWGASSVSQFAQANIGATGRYCQFKFGNNLANRPWRMRKYSMSYKLKKVRANIVTI